LITSRIWNESAENGEGALVPAEQAW